MEQAWEVDKDLVRVDEACIDKWLLNIVDHGVRITQVEKFGDINLLNHPLLVINEHLEHAINIIGEDHLSIGSDFDGAISPPSDLSAGDAYPVLVQKMLDKKWSEKRIQKILGENFLRCFQQLRPDESSLNYAV